MKAVDLDKGRVNEAKNFGTIDDEGKVYLLLNGDKKFIGQYSAGEIDKSMTLFTRRFVDFEIKLDLFEERLNNQTINSVLIIDNAVKSFDEFMEKKNALGDYQKLSARLTKVKEEAKSRKDEIKANRQKMIEDSITKLTEIATKAENLIAGDINSINWKHAANELDTYFDEWKNTMSFQRPPEKIGQELWTRFNNVRELVYTKRREYAVAAREVAKKVKLRKNAIISEANKLKDTNNFDGGAKSFKRLMDEWINAGKGNRKDDDKQWEQFNQARQHFYDRMPKKEVVKKETSVKWENDLTELKCDIKGLDALAKFAKELKQ